MKRTRVLFMKYLKFFVQPHRLIAFLIGVGFLLFVQFVALKPMVAVPVTLPNQQEVLTVSQISDKREKEISVDQDVFDAEALYLGDLMDALEDMSAEKEAFKELVDLDIKMKESEKTVVQKRTKKARIAIVIDDIGMNRTQSWNSVKLDFPVTLAFLPYAENIQEMVNAGLENGHEVIVHVPMQPLNKDVNAGENVLKPGMSEVLLNQALDKNLSLITGYSGINNHMGSAFTQDRKGMNVVMSRLKKEGLFFLDSRTTAESVAEEIAKNHGVPFLKRDVFLDHEETYEYTKGALGDVERIALEYGQAIAIGHPKEITLEALKKWTASTHAKDIEFVTLSELLAK